MTTEDFDIILTEISGKCSRFHVLAMIVLVWFAGHLFCTCQIFLFVFIAYKQNYFCNSTEKSVITNSTGQCFVFNQLATDDNSTMACTEWYFDESVFESTIRSQFNLTCDREWLVSAGATSMMVGFFCSHYAFGPLSDLYGRHVAGSLASVIGTIGAFGAAFAPHYWIYCLMRALVGFSFSGFMLSTMSYSVEIAPSSCRLYYVNAVSAVYYLSGLILVFIAYLQRNHFILQLICASFGLLYFVALLFIPESPRWLLSKGHINRAYKACKWIAKINGKNLTRERFDELRGMIRRHNDLKKESILKILTYPNLRRVTIVICFCFGVSSFVYYTLSLGSGNLGVNVFLNTTLMLLLDILLTPLVTYTAKRFGRVPSLVIPFFGAGLFILLIAPIFGHEGLDHLVTVFFLVGRSFICMAFTSVWVYVTDIFPTVARSSGAAAASSTGRAASLLSPQLENLSKIWLPLPFILSGVTPIVAAIICWIYLPETNKMPTFDYLQNSETFIKLSKEKLFSRKCLRFRTTQIDIDLELDEIKEDKEKELLRT